MFKHSHSHDIHKYGLTHAAEAAPDGCSPDALSDRERERGIYHVTIVGMVVNALLLVFKFVAGILGHSAAMLADAVHSLSDFATDIIVIVFVKISNKPIDKGHDYGHGKYETLGATVVSLILLAVGAGILWHGAADIVSVLGGTRLPEPEPLALWAAIASIVVKEALFQYTRIKGRHLHSSAVEANAWHHRSDALSSVGTAAGIGGAILLGGQWSVLDPIAAVVVSLFILHASWGLLRPCVEELLEKSLPDEVEREILDTIMSFPDVREPHHLRTRRIGNHYAIEAHIRMDGDLPLREAHERASQIERKLRAAFGQKTHIGLHVEPVKDEK